MTKDDQIAALRRDLADARALVHGALHLLQGEAGAQAFASRAEKWLSAQAQAKGE
jgi:hypothetical protein